MVFCCCAKDQTNEVSSVRQNSTLRIESSLDSLARHRKDALYLATN